FVVTDMTGDSTSISDVTEALENADEEATGVTTSKANVSEVLNKLTGTITANAASDVVVVLDPGHGGSDSGAVANGLKEKDLTLKIAKYCKSELETYSGVKVYMTRTTDTYVSLSDRVAYAKKKKADYFVSLHINSGATSANGAEVYYPNGNYNSTDAKNGKKLAQSIQDQLVELGLNDRGIKIRNTENGSTYPDGSVRDYYAVIAGSMEAGFPGIIVEHAFITNSSDVSKYLKSSSKLKKLGVADATGIAEYLGLKKSGSFDAVSITKIKTSGFNNVKIYWDEVSGASSYNVYRKTSDSNWEKLGNTSSTYYKDKTAELNTTYSYAVAPCDSSYEGDKSTSKSITTGSGQVENLTVKSSTFNANRVSWDKLDGVTGYRVYRREGTSGSFTCIADVSSSKNTYKDTTSVCGTTYQYRVRAYRTVSGKNIYGKYSSKGKIKTNTRKVTYTTKNDNGLHRITIEWKALNGVTGYRIYRKQAGKSWQMVVSSTKSTSYTDDDVTAGKKYYYKVKAYKTINKVKYFGVQRTVKIKAGYGKSRVKSVTTGNFNELVIKWTKIDGANNYIIQRREIKGITASSWETIATGVTKRTYTDTTTSCGKTYQYRVKSVRTYNKKVYRGKYSSKSSKGTASDGKVTANKVKVVDTGLKVKWTSLSSVTKYVVYRKAESESSYSKIGTTSKNYYTDKNVTSGTKYYYKLKAYRTVEGKKYYSSAKSNAVSKTAGYTILGDNAVSVEQMVAYFEDSGKSYPSDTYKNYGAETLTDFCQIVYDVCDSYGVRDEIVWAQICKETGYLQFGGDVAATQCNFAGIGATGNGVAGNSFTDVEEGVTAQVQHLKLYASSDYSWSSSVTIVDPRFYTTIAGKAPYVEWLGISTNPYGAGWATASDYSESLLKMIWALRKISV
ncbi:MAG: N-acetylmuramoyl-L-alanine amidase, partial [Lachnospiraceae bacterium]|nr:N-acetylmuramoyl-L-alanine amidase [Lachnospiraceae bacterium]